MKNKILILIIGMILLMGFISAGQETLGVFKQGTQVQLLQNCLDSSYANITRILLPNGSYYLSGQTAMTKSGDDYNYPYNETNLLGEYYVYGNCDESGNKTNWVYDFEITPSGKIASTGESILYFLFVIVLFLLLILMMYFIIVLPKENERGEQGNFIKVAGLKYLRFILIGLIYPLVLIILNLVNGLAINFATLSIFSGVIGFLFEIMMKVSWIFTIIIILIIGYNAIKDSNVKKQIDSIPRFRI